MADGAITEKDLIKARKAEAKERKMAAKKAKFEKSIIYIFVIFSLI